MEERQHFFPTVLRVHKTRGVPLFGHSCSSVGVDGVRRLVVGQQFCCCTAVAVWYAQSGGSTRFALLGCSCRTSAHSSVTAAVFGGIDKLRYPPSVFSTPEGPGVLRASF